MLCLFVAGYWPFDLIICDIWQVSDVMMCTSSIMHMCTISLDRYISIRNPLRIRNKSRTVVGIKMAVVWLLSLMIASPIILLSVLNPQNVLSNHQCAIFNQYFLIYGSLAAYFVPLSIMFIAYTLTIHLLNKQAKLCSKNSSKAGVPMMRRSTSVRKKRHHISRPRNIPEMPATNGLNLARKLQTHIDRNRAHPSEREPLHDEQELESEAPSPVVSRWRRMGGAENGNQNGNGEGTASAGNDPDDERALKLQSLVKKHSAAIKVAGLLLQKRNENQQKKEQMSTVKTERKAVKVLGTMFGIFFVCWAPFFSLNFAIGVCETCNIETSLFKVFLWLGYVSSTLNPIIYTIFNKTFKRTFIAILTCKIFSDQNIHKSVTFTTTNGTSIKVKYDSTNQQNEQTQQSAESMV